ncbi:MAG: DUF2336 domain-containing protein [Pseudolabrys sp.]
MSPERQALLSNLEAAFAKLTAAQRLAILREVTDMFVGGASNFTGEQIAAFDGIMKSLIKDVDSKALIELSGKLSALDCAPAEVMVRLSYDNNLAVAGPILEKSGVLPDVELVSVAKTKGQGHRLAIAGRAQIRPVVTEALVESGDRAVVRKVTANAGAEFSENSFVKLVNEARKDQDLAGLMSRRPDVPEELRPFIKLALA